MTDAAAGPWDSKLTSVVVYAQGAVCRRTARGAVPADGRVRVSGLPRALDPVSLRARVVDASGVRVTEARVVVEAEPAAPDASPELLREVERLTEERRVAQAARDRQVRRIEEITALRPVPPPRKREDPHRRTPVEAWLDLARFVDKRLTGLHAGLVESDDRLRRIEHGLDIATDRYERASTDTPSAPVLMTVSAALTLDGPAATETEVEIEYRAPGAVWVPSYLLTHRQGSGDGRLVLRASVAQRTGEDWTGVRIGLSTADLRRPTGVPTLRSTRIGRRQAAPAPSGWREPPAGLDGLFTGYDGARQRLEDELGGTAWAAGGAIGGAVGGFAGELTVAGGYAPEPPMAGGYGAPEPQGYGRAAPAPQPAMRARAGGRAAAPGAAPPPAAPALAAAPPAPAAPGAAAPPPPPPPGPPRPGAAELDYADLVLSGPDAPGGGRGLLAPGTPADPVATEYRRRAQSVASLPLPGHAVRPRASAGSFDHRYDAEGPADIPSDGTWHTVTVTELPVGLRTEHLCVPSVEETVYATLVVTNSTDQALLAGPVDVTVDGDQLPTTALPTLAPGGTGRVGLGPAEAIRVGRRTELRESTSGLRGTTTVLDHRVHVELANRLPRPVTVEVRERVPVTSQADIRIEEQAGWTAAPEDSPERHAPGTRLWRVDVPAGGTAVLDGGYEIRIPAVKALTGGNRRS